MVTEPPSEPTPATTNGDLALVLTGGGARAAYQVGYLRWIARNMPEANFPILTGVSAGAINATFLASYRGTQARSNDSPRSGRASRSNRCFAWTRRLCLARSRDGGCGSSQGEGQSPQVCKGSSTRHH